MNSRSLPLACLAALAALLSGCPPPPPECNEAPAQLCSRLGKNCGPVTATDVCGVDRTVTCGACANPQTCGGAGTPNVCACPPETDAAFCARLGTQCGTATALDTCGIARSVPSCGTCTGPQTCGGGGNPGACGCTGETDAQLCAQAGRECGSVTAADRCGASRTVASCGTCSAPQTCGGGGTTGACGCTPESDTSFCARSFANCGPLTGQDNCAQARTVSSCGTCTGPQTCGGGGIPNACGCTGETDPELCALLGQNCDPATTTDRCGVFRSIASCGSCSFPQTCGGGGTAGVCGCTPESDASLCSRYSRACGPLTGLDNCFQTRTISNCGTCSSPESCQNGTCRCVSNCPAEGVRQCGPGGVERCQQVAPGCVQWSPWLTCQAAEACQNGACVCGGAACPVGWSLWDVAPGARGAPQMVVDAPNQRLIVLGGFASSTDVWQLALSGAAAGTWSQVPILGPAPAKTPIAIALDGPRQRVLAFIQATGSNLGEVWALSMGSGSSSWTRLTATGTAPIAYTNTAVAIDTARDRLIVYGTSSAVSTLSLGASPAWTTLSLGGTGPYGLARVFYDATTDSAYAFAPSLTNQTAVWRLAFPSSSSGSWTQVATTGGPPPDRFGPYSMVHDPANRLVYLHGGSTTGGFTFQDVWSFDVAGATWTQLSPAGTAPTVTGYGLTFDVAGNRMIRFGGTDTRVYALAMGPTPAWSALSGPQDPRPPSTSRLFYDPVLRRLLTYDSSSQVVWTRPLGAGATWRQEAPTGTAPSARRAAAMAFDEFSGIVYVHGGIDSAQVVRVGDTFALDTRGAFAWRSLPAGNPRSDHVAAWDPRRKRLLVNGGLTFYGFVEALDFSGPTPVWMTIATQKGPNIFGDTLYDHGADLDVEVNRLVTFGGNGNFGSGLGGYENDAFTLSLTSNPALWGYLVNPMTPMPRPTYRVQSGVTRDLALRELVIFGGYDSSFVDLNDAWVASLDPSATPTWTQLCPVGIAPGGRYQANLVSTPDGWVTMGSSPSSTWILGRAAPSCP
ncbi:MAG TPA: kelch repeat-containing protein [Myxococcaceae bacterium]|nr:kelch repeat-containing protein [Myxococcaceae bacterium]